MFLPRLLGVFGAGLAIHLMMLAPSAVAQQFLDCSYFATRVQTEFISSSARADMIVAAKHGDWPAVHAAILAGGDPEDIASSSLYHDALFVHRGMLLVSAVAAGDMDAIKAILAQDSAVADFSNSDDWMTPLFWATYCGRYDAVDALIRAGANVNAPIAFTIETGARVNGATPLHWAAEAGRTDIVYLLLRNGADPDSQGMVLPAPGSKEHATAWSTPLIVSANADITHALLKFGADPNLLDGAGLSPLIVMAGEGRDADCTYLIGAGANRSIKYDGRTPSEIALMAGHKHTAEFIDRERSKVEIAAGEVAFFNTLQSAVRRGDKRWVADHVSYPLRINTDKGAVYVENEALLFANYDRYFSPRIVRAVLDQRPDNLFSNWQGTMIGNGELWFGGDAKDGGYKIFAINTAPIP